MFELIRRLRKKSIAERRRVAFVAALAVTIVIALMWFAWLMSGGLSARMRPGTREGSTPFEGVWGPFKRGAGSLIQSLKD